MPYDFFHEQIEEGGLIKTLEKTNIDLIGTLHVADKPRPARTRYRRNQLSQHRKLVEIGFNGWMAMEYRPTRDPVTSLRESREMSLEAARG